MKNKILASLTVLCAALVLVGGFSVTAYAQTPTEETDDSGVIVETEPQPLTPEGNMTLVDDIDGDAAEDKQFIVVKSKGGNYFYIIVDRAAEGENSVHFLNQVDESDLMAIIGEEQTEQPPAVCNCTEKCKAGEVNTACPACSVNMDSCTGKEATPEEPAEQEQPQNGMGGLLIFLVVGLLGGGAALYYVKFMKPKQNVKGSTDLDEFDFDESSQFGKLLEDLDMPHIRFHDLRHTAATNMHQLTGDFYTVGEVLGHTLAGIGVSLGLSMNFEAVTARYVDVRLERKKEVLDAYHGAVKQADPAKAKEAEPKKAKSAAKKKSSEIEL